MGVELYVTAAGILAVLAFSFLTWRAVSQQRSQGSTDNFPVEIARLQERERRLLQDTKDLTDRAKKLEDELELLRRSETDLKLRFAASQQSERTLGEAVTVGNEKIKGLEKIVEEFRKQTAEKERELTKLTATHANLLEDLTEKKKELLELQTKLTAEFENIATKILKANASELSETSQKQIAAILDPLRERIKDFEGKVENTYDAEKREVLSLKEQIRLMVDTTQNLGSKADGLAKALKGDAQLLGRWGELVLEGILKAAGLEEGREFITQGRALGLKNEAGSTQKPDVILLLPERRTMVIDSKVSLASYDRLIGAKDEAERLQHTAQFVRDMKGHIDDLGHKRYQDNEQISAHDCVLMFVPIEGALAAALTAEPQLFSYAWDKRVVLVGPPTLLMTLRTVASTWQYERRNQNAKAIADQAARLYDKLVGFVADLNEVSEKISKAAAAHDAAVKKLATGKGNALKAAEKLIDMGVGPKSKLKFVIIDGEKRSIDEEDEVPPDMPQQLAAPSEG